MKLINKVHQKSFFDVWKNSKIVTQKEKNEVEILWNKLSNPVFQKADDKIFSLIAFEQSGKTQIMIGTLCKAFDRDPNCRGYILTSYASNAHKFGLSSAVEALKKLDRRFQDRIQFIPAHQMSNYVQHLRSNDFVFFDEDHYGTGLDSQTRFVKLVDAVRNVGCYYGSVSATPYSFWDACIDPNTKKAREMVFHVVKPTETYYGISNMIDDIKEGKHTFVQYNKKDVKSIAYKLAKHSNRTESDRNGVYFIRCRDKVLLKKWIAAFQELGYESQLILCFGADTQKGGKGPFNKIYENGKSLIGCQTDELKEILTKSFDYVKNKQEDLIVFVDGSLGCGVNIDKFCDKEMYMDTSTYPDLYVYQKNKFWVKGVVETSKILTSILQGLLGRICRYIDNGENSKPYKEFENLSKDLFFCFNMEHVELALSIRNDIDSNGNFEFLSNPEKYLTKAEELGVGMYTNFQSDIIDDITFSEANLVGEYSYSEARGFSKVENDMKKFNATADDIRAMKPALHNCITVLSTGGKLSQSYQDRQHKNASFSTSEFSIKEVGGFLKFNFRNRLEHNAKPDWGVGFDKASKKIRLFKKGKLITNYSIAESHKNTAIVNLF